MFKSIKSTVLGPLSIAALVVISLSSAQTMAAPVMLQTIERDTFKKIFTTELKRDRNVNKNGLGGQRGHDMFLRTGDTFSGNSANISWGSSGTVYDWSLSYDGNVGQFVVGNQTLNLDIDPSHDDFWNAMTIIVRSNDTRRFNDALVDVTIDTVNGMAAGGMTIFHAALGEYNEVQLAMNGGGIFQNLSGTMRFNYDVVANGKGSPNGRLAFIVKGLQIAGLVPNTESVPAPPAAALLLVGLGVVAWSRRRKA